MKTFDKQSWEKVRARGKDRFLLRRTASGLWFLVGGAVVELVWWAFTREVPHPLIATAAKYLGMGIVMCAVSGYHEWNTNEKAFHQTGNG